MKSCASISRARPTRVLFLTWGFSIHARRRIQVFVDDPSFEVAVVSTYDYGFQGAKNVLLSGAQQNVEVVPSLAPQSERKDGRTVNHIIRWVIGKVAQMTKTGLGRLHLTGLIRIFSEIRKEIKDLDILRSAFQEFKPDVVFLQTLLYPCYLGYFLSRSTPMMITFWNGDVTWWAKWNGIEWLLKKRLVIYGIRRAEAVTVNSQMALKACLGYGAQEDKIHLVRYPGVDLRRFRPFPKDEARKVLGIRSQKVVLCPRGFGGYLNSDLIVESAARVIKICSDTLFIFVSGTGGHAEWGRHQKQAHELGIDRNLRWDGQVPWELMPMYYNSADVMVSISSVDSLPNCMLEAMSCGVPVIMGSIPQIQEWIVDGFNGFLVPVKDSVALSDTILRVFDNHGGEINSITRRGHEIVRRDADSEKNGCQIKELVHRVVRNHKTSVPD